MAENRDNTSKNTAAATGGPPTILVQAETENPHGWSYEVTIQQGSRPASAHTVTLAWCDHDYWSGGRTAPSKVIQAVLEYALAHAVCQTKPLPPKFDAARIRRICPLIDSELRLPG